jgi:hypothetical protein
MNIQCFLSIYTEGVFGTHKNNFFLRKTKERLTFAPLKYDNFNYELNDTFRKR